MTEQEMLEKWEQATLADDFIFKKFMENEENCKKLLTEICGRPVESVTYHETEKNVKEGFGSKGIRLDVYFVGDDKLYNVEMQNNKIDLPKRNRYYHSMLDLKTLKTGMSYKNIKDAYVIFICTFDPFDKNQYMYKVQNQCTNSKGVEYDDGSYSIFLNTKGDNGEISDYLKSFLKATDGVFDSSDYSVKMKEEIDEIKANVMWRGEYMLQIGEAMDIRDEGRKEGREEGREEGKIEAIKLLLESKSIEEVIALGFDEELVKKATKN